MAASKGKGHTMKTDFECMRAGLQAGVKYLGAGGDAAQAQAVVFNKYEEFDVSEDWKTANPEGLLLFRCGFALALNGIEGADGNS